MDIQKLDDKTIQVTKTPAAVVSTYELSFLLSKRKEISAKAEAYAKQCASELEEIESLIREAGLLGIKE
jgi:hypothetical protein